jgi:hypothetical protein
VVAREREVRPAGRRRAGARDQQLFFVLHQYDTRLKLRIYASLTLLALLMDLNINLVPYTFDELNRYTFLSSFPVTV